MMFPFIIRFASVEVWCGVHSSPAKYGFAVKYWLSIGFASGVLGQVSSHVAIASLVEFTWPIGEEVVVGPLEVEKPCPAGYVVSELATTFPETIGQVTVHEPAFLIVHCETTPVQFDGEACEDGELVPTSKFWEAVPDPPSLSRTVPVTVYEPDFEYVCGPGNVDGGTGAMDAARTARSEAPLPFALGCAAACWEGVQIAFTVPSPQDQVSRVTDAPEPRLGSLICSCGVTVRLLVEIVEAAAIEDGEESV